MFISFPKLEVSAVPALAPALTAYEAWLASMGVAGMEEVRAKGTTGSGVYSYNNLDGEWLKSLDVFMKNEHITNSNGQEMTIQEFLDFITSYDVAETSRQEALADYITQFGKLTMKKSEYSQLRDKFYRWLNVPVGQQIIETMQTPPTIIKPLQGVSEEYLIPPTIIHPTNTKVYHYVLSGEFSSSFMIGNNILSYKRIADNRIIYQPYMTYFKEDGGMVIGDTSFSPSGVDGLRYNYSNFYVKHSVDTGYFWQWYDYWNEKDGKQSKILGGSSWQMSFYNTTSKEFLYPDLEAIYILKSTLSYEELMSKDNVINITTDTATIDNTLDNIGDDDNITILPLPLPIDPVTDKPLDIPVNPADVLDIPTAIPIAPTIPMPPELPDLPDLELPTSIIDKFPFCLPFDLYNLIFSLNAVPEAPNFEVPMVIEEWDIDWSFSIDLSPYTWVAKIFRYLVLAGYVFALIYGTNRLIGRG